LKKVGNELEHSKIVKLDIRYGAIRVVKHDLKLAGISEGTIFPDLNGLGREVSYWFDDNCS
jgi:hypothetical protein